MRLKILIVLTIIALLIITACEKQIQIIEVNNTVKEIHIINNSVQCKSTECICNYPEVKQCEKIICDDSSLRNCRKQTARLIAEVNYYKNLSITYLTNNTLDYLQTNLSNCQEEKEELQDKLRKINESLT